MVFLSRKCCICKTKEKALMNKYFRIFPGMIGLIFAIILLGIGIIKDINKVKIEESCDKITATLSNVTDVERHKNMSSDLDNYNYIQSYAINYMYNNLLYSVSENAYSAKTEHSLRMSGALFR